MFDQRYLLFCLLLAASAGNSLAASPPSSGYGCSNLEANQTLPAIEGKGGYFFRIVADLRMHHELSDHTASLVGTLAKALEASGTTLVYVPIPTKSLVISQYLPEAARQYGFDYEVARIAYGRTIEKLSSNGVITVDLLDAMRNTPEGKPAFLQADFHWTSAGADAAAKVVAERISKLPGFEGAHAHDAFETQAIGRVEVISTMRRILQQNCTEALPSAVTDGYRTIERTPSAASDIFGDKQSGHSIVLVGTSYSDLAASNFGGFLSQHLQMPVTNFAISAGDQFGSITSYMTSDAFQQNRPRVIVWENPIYNNLGKFGDTPLIELMAATRQDCRIVDKTLISAGDDKASSIVLSGVDVPDNAVIYANSGDNLSRHATLRFRLADGNLFESGIWRADRVVSSGRFYFPVRYFGSRTTDTFQLEFDKMSLPDVAVSICEPVKGG